MLRFRNLFSSSLLPLLVTPSVSSSTSCPSPLRFTALVSLVLESLLRRIREPTASAVPSYQTSYFVSTFGIYLPRDFSLLPPRRNPVSSRCLVRCFRCSVHSLVSSAATLLLGRKAARFASVPFPWTTVQDRGVTYKGKSCRSSNVTIPSFLASSLSPVVGRCDVKKRGWFFLSVIRSSCREGWKECSSNRNKIIDVVRAKFAES